MSPEDVLQLHKQLKQRDLMYCDHRENLFHHPPWGILAVILIFYKFLLYLVIKCCCHQSVETWTFRYRELNLKPVSEKHNRVPAADDD